MNIAVSPKALEFHQAHKARRARMAANAWKPVLIEAPKKAVAKVNGYKIIADNNSHVILYRIFRGAVDKFANLSGEKTRLEMRDVQLFVLANSWRFNDIFVPANHFKIGNLNGPARNRYVVLVRQVAMYICKEILEKKSYPMIGRHFGGRDHTTALHAHRKTEERLATGRLLMNGKPFNLDRIGEI
jgi:hypothetical protein